MGSVHLLFQLPEAITKWFTLKVKMLSFFSEEETKLKCLTIFSFSTSEPSPGIFQQLKDKLRSQEQVTVWSK